MKKAAKSLKDRINNTVKLLVSTSRNNTSKPSTYVNNNRQSGSRLVNSLNKAGGLKNSNNIVAKAAQLVGKAYELVKGLSQSNKFVDRYSAGSKMAPILGPKLINSKNLGFGSNVKPPAPGISNLLGRKASYGQAKVEEKKIIGRGNIRDELKQYNTELFALGSKWHFDYNDAGERFIHYGKYRFNQFGQVVEHSGKVIGEAAGKAAKALEYLKNVKPNFFRTPGLFIMPLEIDPLHLNESNYIT